MHLITFASFYRRCHARHRSDDRCSAVPLRSGNPQVNSLPFPRIGALLIRRRVLDPKQVRTLLQFQRRSDEPLGVLAERLFGVDPRTIEKAWVEQYGQLGTTVDLDTQLVGQDTLGLLTRRQAWQFRLLPLRREDGLLVMATTRQALPRAARFAWKRLGAPVYMLLGGHGKLITHLRLYYPWPAMEGSESRGAGHLQRRQFDECG